MIAIALWSALLQSLAAVIVSAGVVVWLFRRIG
jgi:hypothetical protein